MCHKITKINQTVRGQLLQCKSCNFYQLIFNNLFFEFSPEQLSKFKKYILDIDIEYWEDQYPTQCAIKKTPIPTGQDNLVLLFNSTEIEELKQLVFNRKPNFNTYEILNANEVMYTSYLN